MSEKKYYTVSDISKRYNLNRANIYYYMKKYSEHLSNEDIKSIDREGLIKILEDLNIEVDSNLNIKGNKQQDKESHDSEEEKTYELLREQYEERLKAKEEEIERLSSILDKQIELNRNNQVLIKNSLEKIEQLELRKANPDKKRSFWSKIFRRKI